MGLSGPLIFLRDVRAVRGIVPQMLLSEEGTHCLFTPFVELMDGPQRVRAWTNRSSRVWMTRRSVTTAGGVVYLYSIYIYI